MASAAELVVEVVLVAAEALAVVSVVGCKACAPGEHIRMWLPAPWHAGMREADARVWFGPGKSPLYNS